MIIYVHCKRILIAPFFCPMVLSAHTYFCMYSIETCHKGSRISLDDDGSSINVNK